VIIENPKVGSDVEFFVMHYQTHRFVSAEGLIHGSKEAPFKFDPKEPMFATQLDNVLAEGNIPPAETSKEFCAYLLRLRSYIDSVLPRELRTVAIGSARLEEKFLQSDNAKSFGCSPSLCAWTRSIAKVAAPTTNLRSAGFHVHVGYNGPNVEANISLAKAMDLFLGVPAVLVEPEDERRKLGYGTAGNFRHADHGCEYRVLSSWWAGNEQRIKWVYDATMTAISFVNSGGNARLRPNMGAVIQRAINEGDKTLAKGLLNVWRIPMPGEV
jgi:hypothetical protein